MDEEPQTPVGDAATPTWSQFAADVLVHILALGALAIATIWIAGD